MDKKNNRNNDQGKKQDDEIPYLSRRKELRYL
jgi:hypothetical protein